MGHDHISNAFKERHKWNDTIKNIKLWYWMKISGLTQVVLSEKLHVQPTKISRFIIGVQAPTLREALLIHWLSEGQVPLTSMALDLEKETILELRTMLNENRRCHVQ